MGDSAAEIATDIAAVGRIEAVPTMLRVLCDITGMRFAAVARVTDGTWTACAVQDDLGFGLQAGGQLDVHSTLCKEVREARTPIVIEQASTDAVYCGHHTPRTYSIESYVSVPIILHDGAYFGNLCAIDTLPAKVGEPRIVAMFNRFAELIASQLDADRRREAVQSALLDERSASELREQLIAILGHDLRIPLGQIAMGCQLLQGRSTEKPVVDAVAGIKASGRRISALIDDVLDFARGRLGSSMGIKPDEIERIDEAIFGVVSELQLTHPGREIEWQFDVTLPVRVDRGRVQQLASNLLSNALAHGAPGSPVKLSATTTADELVLEVWNAGTPIAPQNLDKVFEPFWRNEASAQGDGLGLGLHICAQIARAHGGWIGVTSSADQGTRFTVTLPRMAPSA